MEEIVFKEQVAIEAAWSVDAIAFRGSHVYYVDGKNAAVLDTTTMKVKNTVEGRSIILSLAFSENGRYLFMAFFNHTARVVDLKMKRSVNLFGHTHQVLGIIECEDTDVLTCSMDNTIRRWNRFTGQCIRIFKGGSDWDYSILYDRRSQRIFSGSVNADIRVWNARTGEQIEAMKGHNGSIFTLAFVNATTIVSGSADNTVKTWDIATMKETKTMSSHTSFVRSVAVTPDELYVVSGSDDATIKVWIIATGECIASLSRKESVLKVAVSPDGRYIAFGTHATKIYVHAVAPHFPFVVHMGLLASNDKVSTNHRLLSDGRLLCSNGVANVSITHSTSCSLESENQFSFTNRDSSSSSSSNFTFYASSGQTLQLWLEAICAVRDNLALATDRQSFSKEQIIHRHRFNILQFINFHHRRCRISLLLPKDVTQIIGRYATKI